jgi:hypothetical protein
MPPKRKAKKQTTDASGSDSFEPPKQRKAQLNFPLAQTLTLDSAQGGIELLASAERDGISLDALLSAMRALVPIVESAERALRHERCSGSVRCNGSPTIVCCCKEAKYCAACAEKFLCKCLLCSNEHWCNKCVRSCDFCRKTAKDKESRLKNRYAAGCLLEKKCGKLICLSCDEVSGLEEDECDCSECFRPIGW